MKSIACPICKLSKSQLLFKLGQKLTPYSVSICQNCGFVFQNPRWTQERLNEYYQTEYDSIHRPKGKSLEPNPENPDAIKVFQRSQRYLPPKVRRILDYGAGRGDVISCFRNRLPPEVDFLAIEPSIIYRQTLIAAKFNVIDFPGVNPRFELGHVDFIAMRHVVEHFDNPITSLIEALTLLRPNGIIYLAVPNVMHGAILDCLSFPHVSYFNEATFRVLVSMLPLNVLDLKVAGDEIYGIFEKRISRAGAAKDTDRSNYAFTIEHINSTLSWRVYLLRRLRRIISFLIPARILRQLIKLCAK